MSDVHQVAQILAEVGPHFEDIEQIDVLTEETWAVIFSEETMIEVHCDETGHQLCFMMPIATLDEQQRAERCELLLSYNFLKRETGGFHMALDGEPGNVYLMLDVHHLNIDVNAMAGLLATVLETGLNWREALSGAANFESDDPGEGSSATDSLMTGAIPV